RQPSRSRLGEDRGVAQRGVAERVEQRGRVGAQWSARRRRNGGLGACRHDRDARATPGAEVRPRADAGAAASAKGAVRACHHVVLPMLTAGSWSECYPIIPPPTGGNRSADIATSVVL